MSDSNLRIARVKGWRSLGDDETGTYWITQGGQCRHCDWSGSIADAWALVDEMVASGATFFIGGSERFCRATFSNLGVEMANVDAPTAPEAIAAAYLAVMEER